jgi:hypothetical protein
LPEDGGTGGFRNVVIHYKLDDRKSPKKKSNLTFGFTHGYLTANPDAVNSDERNTSIEWSSADKVSA